MMAGKGDGKQRRPKVASPSADPPAPPPEPSADKPAGRVSSDSLLSVRKQIVLVRAFRERQSKGAPSKQRTSFRKKAGADSAAAKAAAELCELPDGKYCTIAMPLLLVDG